MPQVYEHRARALDYHPDGQLLQAIVFLMLALEREEGLGRSGESWSARPGVESWVSILCGMRGCRLLTCGHEGDTKVWGASYEGGWNGSYTREKKERETRVIIASFMERSKACIYVLYIVFP